MLETFDSRQKANADERSRTSTSLSPQAPEACASANSATSAAMANNNMLAHLVKIFVGKLRGIFGLNMDWPRRGAARRRYRVVECRAWTVLDGPIGCAGDAYFELLPVL